MGRVPWLKFSNPAVAVLVMHSAQKSWTNMTAEGEAVALRFINLLVSWWGFCADSCVNSLRRFFRLTLFFH